MQAGSRPVGSPQPRTKLGEMGTCANLPNCEASSAHLRAVSARARGDGRSGRWTGVVDGTSTGRAFGIDVRPATDIECVRVHAPLAGAHSNQGVCHEAKVWHCGACLRDGPRVGRVRLGAGAEQFAAARRRPALGRAGHGRAAAGAQRRRGAGRGPGAAAVVPAVTAAGSRRFSPP